MESPIVQIASLIGDRVRAKILWALLDGKAYSATELAISADTSPQNASMHLSKLVQADLLKVERQGRYRYYRFSRREVAYAIEALAGLVSREGNRHGEVNTDIKHCRTCYDHLAGKVAVLITNRLLTQKWIVENHGSYEVNRSGTKWFKGIGIDVMELRKQRRSLARPCLDWSERQYHIAGSLGAALLETMLTRDWIRRINHSRAVMLTANGQKHLYDYFKLECT